MTLTLGGGEICGALKFKLFDKACVVDNNGSMKKGKATVSAVFMEGLLNVGCPQISPPAKCFISEIANTAHVRSMTASVASDSDNPANVQRPVDPPYPR